MTARVDYLVSTKNRCVVAYSSDGGGGNLNFFIGPSAFGATPNITDTTYATKGLTFTSAALSRVVGSAGGAGGSVTISFAGATAYPVFVFPYASSVDNNFERITLPNLSQGSTGMVSIVNTLVSGATANIMMEFVTRHV